MWLYHDMLSVSHTHTHTHISRQSWVFCPLLLSSLMMCANDKVHYYPMVVFVCLHITLPHYHHHADLSESIEFIKCLSGTFCFESAPTIKSILSIIFHATCGAVRIQLSHLSYDDCEYMCTLSYYQMGSMTHSPMFRSWQKWYALYIFWYFHVAILLHTHVWFQVCLHLKTWCFQINTFCADFNLESTLQ